MPIGENSSGKHDFNAMNDPNPLRESVKFFPAFKQAQMTMFSPISPR
jgi:hypothetical protein